MKPPVKFLSFVLGITSLLSLIFLIYPRSLSPQISSVATETAAPPSLDFDGSGIVDFPDFLMFVSAFGAEEGQDKYDAKYDLNSDGKIAFEDFLILTDNFGKNVVAQKSPTSSDQNASTIQSMAENTGATGATLPVTALEESVVASTPQPLTEATLNGSVVTLTLSGTAYESFFFDIQRNVKVSGIAGVSVGTFDIDRVSDTVVTVKLTFNGNMTANGTLTFTVGADALANYNGSPLTATLPVTALEESVVASTPQPLTEATLNGSVVTLTLSGTAYESFFFDIQRNVKVSGIAGVSVGTFGIRRVSDTVVTIELTFSGDLTTNGTLTFTVEADAIAGYDGPALTATLPVTAGPGNGGQPPQPPQPPPQPPQPPPPGGGTPTGNLDLIVESPTVSDSSPDAGAYFTLSATVRNQGGERSSSTTLRYYLSTDGTITTGDTEVETDYVTRLNPSETSDESARIKAPSSEGTYYYGACVDAVSGESNTNNNCSSAVTVTVLGSDLIVESPAVSDSTPGPGASFTLSATVRNQGGGAAPSTTLRYYLSTDAVITTGDTEVDTDYVTSLDPSETSDERAYLDAPSSEGTYYYGACVESVTGESDTVTTAPVLSLSRLVVLIWSLIRLQSAIVTRQQVHPSGYIPLFAIRVAVGLPLRHCAIICQPM